MLDPMLLQLFEADAQDRDTSRADDVAFLVATLARVERARRWRDRVQHAATLAMALVLTLALVLASQLLTRSDAGGGERLRDANPLAGAIESAAHALGTLLATPPLWACAVVLLLAASTLVRTLHGGWR